MKKKVMNIRPQEFTDGGERSVRYKGSDGKMHAMLPQNAAVPVAERTVIEAGTEITLAQAHEIEDFDFNKCSSLGFTKEFSVYEEISVNREEDGTNYLYLHYPGHENIYIKTDGSVYEPFSDTNEAELKSDFQYPYDDAKSFLAETLLAIAKQTGKLVIFHQDQSHEMVPGYYENAIVLTMAEDIVTGEEFFITKSSGEHMKIGLPKDAAVPVVHRSIIERGSEITLAQAHAIEGFDFENCASLRFNEGYSPYNTLLVNLQSSDNAESSRYLEYSYPGSSKIRFHKDGNYYPFLPSSEVPSIHNFPNDEQGAKEMLEQVLLEIAKQTGKLELYNPQGQNGEQVYDLQNISGQLTPVPYYEDAVLLTIKNDILLSEEFFVESFTGDLLKLPTVREDDEDSQEPSPYRLQNNPNAYEIIDSGQMNSHGQKIYKAKACDGTETFLDATMLYEKLLNDPYTIVIYKDTRPGSSGICTAILQFAQHDESTMCVRLHGELLGNSKATYNIYVYGKNTENRISVDKSTS